MATKTLLTVGQFDQLPVKEGILYELNEGELVTMTEPMPRHNLIRDNIVAALRAFVQPHDLGRVFAETGYQLTPDTVRIPDVSFVPAGRMREIDLDRRIQGAPTLAMEVVSPSDLAEELTHKVEQYLAAGSKSVWVIYPKSREVHVFRPTGVTVLRNADAVLEEKEILPGFSLPLSALFEN
jgi:Uma2 family endonuclease